MSTSNDSKQSYYYEDNKLDASTMGRLRGDLLVALGNESDPDIIEFIAVMVQNQKKIPYIENELKEYVSAGLIPLVLDCIQQISAAAAEETTTTETMDTSVQAEKETTVSPKSGGNALRMAGALSAGRERRSEKQKSEGEPKKAATPRQQPRTREKRAFERLTERGDSGRNREGRRGESRPHHHDRRGGGDTRRNDGPRGRSGERGGRDTMDRRRDHRGQQTQDRDGFRGGDRNNRGGPPRDQGWGDRREDGPRQGRGESRGREASHGGRGRDGPRGGGGGRDGRHGGGRDWPRGGGRFDGGRRGGRGGYHPHSYEERPAKFTRTGEEAAPPNSYEGSEYGHDGYYPEAGGRHPPSSSFRGRGRGRFHHPSPIVNQRGRGRGRFPAYEQVKTMVASKQWVRKKEEPSSETNES